jgi:hypothetical protein
MLLQFPPMGVYETLFKIAAATNKYMGAGISADNTASRWAGTPNTIGPAPMRFF